MTGRISYEGKQSLRWIRVASCMVTFMEANVDFDDGLWDDWIRAFSHDSIKALMVCSWDPTQPTNQQWRRATRVMRERNLPVVVVTEARHNLALAKAASWLGTNITSFRWNELADACQQVGFASKLVPAARAKIVALRDTHGKVTGDVTMGTQATSNVSRANYPNSPMTASRELVEETNSEIQATLEALQKRLRSRNQANTFS